MKRTYEMQPVTADVQVLPQDQWSDIPEAKNDAYALAEIGAFRELLRAGLAKQVMDNTAVLAKFEEHYNSIAPSGSAEYRYIVQTYARAAMERIIKGER